MSIINLSDSLNNIYELIQYVILCLGGGNI